jgi:hypothetical protein
MKIKAHHRWALLDWVVYAPTHLKSILPACPYCEHPDHVVKSIQAAIAATPGPIPAMFHRVIVKMKTMAQFNAGDFQFHVHSSLQLVHAYAHTSRHS